MKINNIEILQWEIARGDVVIAGKKGRMTISYDVVEFFLEKLEGKNTYLEIGTFDGIAVSILAENNIDKQFYVIDPFKKGTGTGAGCLGYFIDNNRGLANVNLFIGTTDTVEVPYSLDVVFIDGDHSYEWIKKDFYKVYPHMKSGGIIAFHDYPMQGVKEAIDEICLAHGYKLNYEPSLVWIQL